MTAATEKTATFWFIDNLVHVHVSGEQTEGRLALVETVTPRGHMPPLHVHHHDDEAFFVLEGEITVYVGDTVRSLTAGESALGPRGVAHTFRVESETARILVSSAPAGFERFVAAIGEPAPELVLPSEPVLPDPDRMAEIAAEHGIELLGPPGTLPS